MADSPCTLYLTPLFSAVAKFIPKAHPTMLAMNLLVSISSDLCLYGYISPALSRFLSQADTHRCPHCQSIMLMQLTVWALNLQKGLWVRTFGIIRWVLAGFFPGAFILPLPNCRMPWERLDCGIWSFERPPPMSNTSMFQGGRNQRIPILVASIQIDLYLYPHSHMQKYICISMSPCFQTHGWIVCISP